MASHPLSIAGETVSAITVVSTDLNARVAHVMSMGAVRTKRSGPRTGAE